ncbi:MAG: hypothetical protein ACRDPH_13620 [Marmoricola sp.]
MGSEEQVRRHVVRALVNAYSSKYPILTVASVEAQWSPTEAERAAAQEALVRSSPTP